MPLHNTAIPLLMMEYRDIHGFAKCLSCFPKVFFEVGRQNLPNFDCWPFCQSKFQHGPTQALGGPLQGRSQNKRRLHVLFTCLISLPSPQLTTTPKWSTHIHPRLLRCITSIHPQTWQCHNYQYLFWLTDGSQQKFLLCIYARKTSLSFCDPCGQCVLA